MTESTYPRTYTKTLYTISPIKQLIDINSNVVNFECRLQITSLDKKPFEAVVVSDTDLQTREQLPFERDRDGVFAGDVRITKNAFEPYYLVLRAPEQRTVEVQMEFERLPEYVPQNNGIRLDTSVLSDTLEQYQKWLIVGGLVLTAMGILWVTRANIPMTASPTSGGAIMPRARSAGHHQSLLTQLKSMSETGLAPTLSS